MTTPLPLPIGPQLVAAAEALSRAAHAGQVDKSGAPYAAHPARVAARVADDPLAAAVAWLHDVIEDTGVDAAQLRRTGFPDEVLDAVLLLTRDDAVPADDYYRAIRANPIALRVKLADIADNSDPARLATIDVPTRERLRRKYSHALTVLSEG